MRGDKLKIIELDTRVTAFEERIKHLEHLVKQQIVVTDDKENAEDTDESTRNSNSNPFYDAQKIYKMLELF